MSKEYKRSPAQAVYAKSDTEINLSYDVMKELRRGLSLHSYTYQEQGDWKCDINLVYTTLDGKKHQLCSTEIKL